MELGKHSIDVERQLTVEIEYENVIIEDAFFGYIRLTFDDVDCLMEILDKAMYGGTDETHKL